MDILDKVRKLLELANSPEPEEARSAAHKAAKLIREHGLVLSKPVPFQRTVAEATVANWDDLWRKAEARAAERAAARPAAPASPDPFRQAEWEEALRRAEAREHERGKRGPYPFVATDPPRTRSSGSRVDDFETMFGSEADPFRRSRYASQTAPTMPTHDPFDFDAALRGKVKK